MGLTLIEGGKPKFGPPLKIKATDPDEIIIEKAFNGFALRVIVDSEEQIYLVANKYELQSIIRDLWPESGATA